MGRIYKGDMKILMPFFQAMEKGRIIQVKNGNDWIDVDSDEEGLNIETLIGNQNCYRIKPEPKYRPFANAEECWAEMQKHQPFGWLECVGCRYNIVSVSNIDVSMANVSGDILTLRFCDVMETDTFADGTTFGVNVEE